MRHELIGIAGTFAAGKDTITNELVKRLGYTHISTSEIVREIARNEYGSIERPVMFKVADTHRKRYGADYFVRRALERERPLIITGLRSPGEARAIQSAGGLLIFVDAPIELRYQRMVDRQRDKEAELTLEQFRENEQAEWHSGDGDDDFSFRTIKEIADLQLDSSKPQDEYISDAMRAIMNTFAR